MVDTRIRILLVEDDPDVRPLVEHILFSAGYRVDVAASCAAALERLNGVGAYDLVIADGRLGDGSGITVADRGRETGAKTLVMTGYAFQFSEADRERHPLVWKPIRAGELLGLVAERLRERSPRS